MHHRDESIEHTTAHNVEMANSVPVNLLDNIDLSDTCRAGEDDAMNINLQIAEGFASNVRDDSDCENVLTNEDDLDDGDDVDDSDDFLNEDDVDVE